MNNPVVGYGGFNRMVEAGNVYSEDYQKSRVKASLIVKDNAVKQEKRKKRRVSRANSRSTVSISQTFRPYSKTATEDREVCSDCGLPGTCEESGG